MANVSVQLKRIDTQADAESSSEVLLDGQPIRVRENGRIYWGNGTDDLATIVSTGEYTVPSPEIAAFLEDGDVVQSGLQFRDGTMRLNDEANTRILIVRVADGQLANRTLRIDVQDANRTLVLSGDAQISGINTGDDASDPAGAAAAALADAQAYADGLVVSVFRAAGNWGADVGTWPTSGTGSGGAIRRGDTYNVDVEGNIAGRWFDIGDVFYANANNPGQTASNWSRFETNTDQATEAERGTLRVATQSAVEIEVTTNDIDAVTPKKLWQAFAKAWTVSAFLNAVRGTLLTGLSLATGTPITASDSILVALGKLQKQITDLASSKADVSAPAWLNYTAGSQNFNTTSLVNVTGTEIAIAGAGLHEYEFVITYDAAALTTGSGWGVGFSGGAASDYLSLVTIMSVNQNGAMNVSPASTGNGAIFNATSRFTTGNTAIVHGNVNITAAGNLLLRCMSEVAGSNITVTDVKGFIKRKA